MERIGWRFPPLSGGTRQGYTNNDIEVFKGQELIDNLAREICQNSLDARDDFNSPVKVVFEFCHIEKAKYDMFSEYQQCLDGCRKYWGEEMDAKLSSFLDDADETLSQDTIPMLVASDYNTKGLDGSRSKRLKTPWEALTGSDGMSVKNDDNSGGSYGIGKNAPFACSSLSMVFYNTVANDGESAFIGVARVATLLNQDGKPTQRVGKYQVNNDEEEIWNPIYVENENAFRDFFHRTEKGTDVIISGFNQETDWMNNVTKAVLKNFFVAISEENLIVVLKDATKTISITAENIAQLFVDYENDREMIVSSQLYNAFICPDAREQLDILNKSDVEVFIKSDSSFRRVVANFRSTGMLVGSYSRRIFQHYAAVVVVRGQELGELLRDTEPPRHNRWDYKLIKASDAARRKSARQSIAQIEDSVLAFLKNQYETTGDETIDAVGIGEYLPDSADNAEGCAEGDDILKAKIKIGRVKTYRKRESITTVDGTKAEGAAQEGDVNNEGTNPTPPPPLPIPKPVDVENPGDDPVDGVVAGPGTKIVRTPHVSAQRAFPVSASNGVYKIIIVPSESYDNLYLSCNAIGEDGKSDSLNMESFTYNGKSIGINNGTAGPISVEQNKPSVFFAKFSNKEKMIIRLQLTEVVTK